MNALRRALRRMAGDVIPFPTRTPEPPAEPPTGGGWDSEKFFLLVHSAVSHFESFGLTQDFGKLMLELGQMVWDESAPEDVPEIPNFRYVMQLVSEAVEDILANEHDSLVGQMEELQSMLGPLPTLNPFEP